MRSHDLDCSLIVCLHSGVVVRGDGPEFTVVSSDLDMVVRCVGPDGQVVEFLESRLERSAW